jgi:hypothetical protein
MKPQASIIRGLIKIHTYKNPLRPVGNWINAPAYQLSKHCQYIRKPVQPSQCIQHTENNLSLMGDLK